MNIVKLLNPILESKDGFELPVPIDAILTDMPIWFNHAGGSVNIIVFGTGKIRSMEISNIKYICPIGEFKGE